MPDWDRWTTRRENGCGNMTFGGELLPNVIASPEKRVFPASEVKADFPTPVRYARSLWYAINLDERSA